MCEAVHAWCGRGGSRRTHSDTHELSYAPYLLVQGRHASKGFPHPQIMVPTDYARSTNAVCTDGLSIPVAQLHSHSLPQRCRKLERLCTAAAFPAAASVLSGRRRAEKMHTHFSTATTVGASRYHTRSRDAYIPNYTLQTVTQFPSIMLPPSRISPASPHVSPSDVGQPS